MFFFSSHILLPEDTFHLNLFTAMHLQDVKKVTLMYADMNVM